MVHRSLEVWGDEFYSKLPHFSFMVNITFVHILYIEVILRYVNWW